MSFPDQVREKALLWSDRHCCVCGKQCGIMIELHHIVPSADGSDNSIDNALPVCFECHCHIQHYNTEHPRGSKYKESELKRRRDQVYELHTSRYVPPVEFALRQTVGSASRELPDVGFLIAHKGGPYPVQAFVKISSTAGQELMNSEYYNGARAWNLNPGFSISGHFQLPDGYSVDSLSLRLEVILKDVFEREHKLLPLAYTFSRAERDWYLEPSPQIA